MRKLRFAKGHGTRNDFVLLVDEENQNPLSTADVRFLCDRRSGIGGDGVLRAVRARHIPDWSGDPGLWFMDYRNADGSLAEMCGNGLRVFARYLRAEGLVTDESVQIGTRAGLRSAEFVGDLVRAQLGRVTVETVPTWIRHAGKEYVATKVAVGNPHAVVFLDSAEELATLDLEIVPEFDEIRFPSGVNVEFVVELEEASLRMRVHERGVGETESCGTGIVASSYAWALERGFVGDEVMMEVPGGQLMVGLGAEASLLGPAVIVAHGEVELPGGE